MPRREPEPNDLAKSVSDVEAGLGRQLRAEALRYQFERMRAVFVYDLEEMDRVTLGMAPPTNPETLTRLLTGELVGRGVFRILEDEMGNSEWANRQLSFGTYAAGHGPIAFESPGILRGFITPGGCVTVDLAGKDFFNEGADIQYYPDIYVSLSVNDTEIFGLNN